MTAFVVACEADLTPLRVSNADFVGVETNSTNIES